MPAPTTIAVELSATGNPQRCATLFYRFLSQLHHCLATGQTYDPATIHITGTWTDQYSVAPDAPGAPVFEIAM